MMEFIDTWLVLAERLIHPKYLLETLYALPDKGNTSDYVKFNPVEYLKNMLKVGVNRSALYLRGGGGVIFS